MSTPKPPGLDPELLDDFFSEADEHLLSIRQALLKLEAFVDKAQPEPKIVEDLFRDFHSFKGISAIVGLAAAEAVAHASEDFLRLMKTGKVPLTIKGMEVLAAATQKLEQLVVAFRAQKPLPGYQSLLTELKEQCGGNITANSATEPVSPPTSSTTSDTAFLTQVEEAKSRGLTLWKYTFSPSQALNAQGVNINTMRAQLAEVGEILKSTPLVRGKGSVAFEFLIAARNTPTDIATWEAKGMVVQLAEAEEGNTVPLPSASNSKSLSEEETHNPFLAPSHVVRVDLKRLDELMRITGEMVIHRSRLDAQLARLDHGAAGGVDFRGVQEASGSLNRSLREMREAIMRVRLVPVAEIFARMPFVVRDLARDAEKKVRLKLAGQDASIDKYLIERLKDPLLHLVRNAFSHGVESAAERAAAAKPPEATIELSAANAGDSVVIQVGDDGRGINPNAIVERARKLGMEVPDAVDNAAILQILCSSGFSTREDADRAAGRGVGMAVVYATVRELGGSLTLESEEGRGTRFTLRLPLTLAIAETFIITAAGQTCAVPQGFVREILHTSEDEIQMVNGIEAIAYRSGVLPVVRLAGIFKLKSDARAKLCLLVIESERGSIGLLAESILGQREVVVRALRDPLIQIAGISGATELGDGKPVLILDGAALASGNVRPLEFSNPSRKQELSAAQR